MAMDLSKLNKEQRGAVVHGNGPVLIVAGAGTGKTTVITSRFAYLIKKGKAGPEEILAVTFTEKAAGEMEDRVGDLLSLGYTDLWISTFHSFCERILRDNGLDIGLDADFKILDETASWLLLRQNLDKFDLRYYKPIANPSKFIRVLVSHFQRCKDQEIWPKDYLKYAKKAKEDRERILEIAKTYQTYQELILKNGFLDFGDFINYCLKLFKERPQILEKYRKQFKYILVDEFQDANWAQYKLVKLLAVPKNNLTVCSDDDQSIYKFRGASFSNIIQFRKDFPKAKQIVLLKNYRSSQNILDLAYRFIQANNPNRLEKIAKINKKLKAENKGEGEIAHLYFGTLEEEAQGTANKIIEILKKDRKANLSDFAILVRANNYTQSFCRALEGAEIPFQFLAMRGLYSTPVILDIISYFKLLDNYHESSALYRILNLPFLKISSDDIAKIIHQSRKKFKSIYESLQELSLISGVSLKTKNAVSKILSLIKKHSEISRQKNVSELALAFLEDFGYLEHLAKAEQQQDLNYISQFFGKLKKFEQDNINPKLKNFMEELNLELEAGEEGKLSFNIEEGPDVVKVMTIHSAKGLEFKYVFLVNLVDKRFPSIERKESIEIPTSLIKDIIPRGEAHLEEERRLFYVGMTRAKIGLYFTSAEDYGGEREKKISMFLRELGYKNHDPKACFHALVHGSKKEEGEIIKIRKKFRANLPEYFSFTQLIAFSTCPLQYKFAHILKIPVKGRATFSFGKTMHKTLFEFVSRSIEKQRQFRDLLKIYDKNWIDEWYESKKQRDEYYELGRKSLEKFYKNFIKEKPEIYFIKGKPALEQNFNFKIGDCKIIGKIDRIDKISNTEIGSLQACRDPISVNWANRIDKKGEKIEIIDYKTGSGKEKLKTEDKTQLLIYQIAAEQVFGLKPEKLSYYYLDEGKKISFLGTEKEIEKEKEKIISKIEEIKKSDFAPTPSRHCLWCDFKEICEFARKY